MQKNIIRHNYTINKEDRSSLKKHKPLLLWFADFSGSEKSTIANLVEQILFDKGYHTYTLDGDNVRQGLNSNLSFSPEDRSENIRRISEVANLMVDAGLIVLAAFVSPYIKDRDLIKSIVGSENLVEIFINTSVEECERRDVKGLHKKARAGEIKNKEQGFAPYEVPLNPDIEIKTEDFTAVEAANQIVNLIIEKKNLIMNNYTINHLRELESEAIFVIREIASQFERPALLFSGGKDSIFTNSFSKKSLLSCKNTFSINTR